MIEDNGDFSPESIRQLLQSHQGAPWWIRARNRLTGAYPPSAERERLRRYDLGPIGRALENVYEGSWWMRKANRSPKAVLTAGWVSEIPAGTDHLSTMIAGLEAGGDYAGSLATIMSIGGIAVSGEEMDGVSFYGPSVRWETVRSLAKRATWLGVAAYRGNTLAGSTMIPRLQLEEQPGNVQSALEVLTRLPLNLARTTYYVNKPGEC